MSAAAEVLGNIDGDASALQCAWIDAAEDFIALAPEWDTLQERARVGHPFLSHAWLRTWWEHFAGDAQLRILVARAGGTLVGAAPMMLVTRRIYGMRVRALEAMAGDHTPRFEFLAGHDESAVHAALWAAIRACDDEWDIVNIRQLPEGSATLTAVRACAARDGLRTGCWPGEVSPFVRFSDAWNRYFDSLGYNHRRNVGKSRRRLERRGGVALEVIQGGPGLAAQVGDGMRIEASAWKADAGTAMLSEPQRRRFYERLAERVSEQGQLRLYFLRCGGRRIAFSYAIVASGVVYVLKAGYDPQYARFSPYQVLCAMVLKEGFRSGLRGYDFLGGAEPWKREWTHCARPHQWLYVFSPRIAAQWVYLLKFRLSPLIQKLAVARGLRNLLLRSG
ncbi:MAG: GNAT family N-acetyltransferase [Xanthomonadaceae bacterium]|nr:GNAT family N-acetyltransferase [Xanthomonadaceae bacterium]